MAESNIEIHTRVGNDQQNWTANAETLFEGSKVLKRERERSFQSGQASIYSFSVWIEIMLTAFGMECLIKAIWIKQGNRLARDGKYIPIIKDERHQLVKLCEAVGFALNQREADVLERMCDIATSIGRYPIPRRAGQSEGVCSWSSEDDDIIENLVVKLRTQLQ